MVQTTASGVSSTGPSFECCHIEAVIWKVPNLVRPSKHLYEYRLVYVVSGERVVGLENERGKGDHYHRDGTERHYSFTTIDQLMADFIAEIEKRRKQ